MPPTVILIRHAQALHIPPPPQKHAHHPTNPLPRDYHLHDPALSPLGYGAQCRELSQTLQKSLPIAQDIDLIVVSPMRRTLQTAQQGLGWLIRRGVPVILRAEWQENSAKPCDTGTDIEVMEKEWPFFDWSTVDPLYPAKTGLYHFSKQGLERRGVFARKWLRARPEKVIAVVSHSGFLRVGVCEKQFENADFRVFDFAEEKEGEEDVGGRLVEWELTEKNGGGLGKSAKGHFPLEKGDYPEQAEVVKKDAAAGEVVNEKPEKKS